MNFWDKLKKPFFILAPMADVTDWAFRQIVVEAGKPDVFFTEFTSCDGLCSGGRDKLIKNLFFTENERPIVAQFFGSKPDNFYKCARLAKELGFDGIDINMGCPDRKVLKQGGGAVLIKYPELAKEIIFAAKEGAGNLPVSVKTRLGCDKIEIEEWLSHLISAKPAAITIHGRTKKELSLVPAHWDEIGRAAAMAKGSGIYIIGNGDVLTLEEGNEKARQYQLDGIMIGRGIFSNPWLFSGQDVNLKNPQEKIEMLLKHVELFCQLWGSPPANGKNFAVMKRFFKIYIQGWPASLSGGDGAKDLRTHLMEAKSKEDVHSIIQSYLGFSLIKNVV